MSGLGERELDLNHETFGMRLPCEAPAELTLDHGV
jgi:hypothetical protein